ncbi:TIM-barrel domain-containing protein [Frigoribacterium sp. 2-23]|uniref:glycoside hydrolase family 31 protein n=1 Tax=Frigoribacterium sp. 2-23 TaxID=3415006 RepID=UPI003C6F5EA8
MPARPPALPVIRPLPGTAPRVATDNVVVGPGWRIGVLADGLFRIERAAAPAAVGAAPAADAFEDRASTFAVRRDLGPVEFTVERQGGGVVVTTARARLRYDGRDFSSNGLAVDLIGADTGRWRFGDETRDLGGTARTLDDVDGRVALESGVIAEDGIAVVDDSESFLFDDEGWIGLRRPEARDLYVFAYGRDYTAAVQALYAVSGPPMLLPRWALGNWWSRYHPYSAASYVELMDRFADERLPFSVAVIDMDWHRVASVPERFGTGWTGYSWEPELFPDPGAFLAELHRRGLRTTLNLHPADGVRAFEDAYPAMARAVGVDPASGEPVPFDLTRRDVVEAYFHELHHPLEEQGVDFWWIDWQQGRTTDLPGVDPLWLLNHFHHLDAARAGAPGMTFSRYAGPGSHRYAVGFSGDAVVSWASLAFQPEFTATAANIGYGWWSHDIGGHTRGVRDDELATRWVQFGVFSPIMRLHSANNPFIRKEPWLFPAEHEAAMGEALRLRHRMVPYLHTMNHRAADEGIPLVRPIYHLEPRRREAYGVPNEYEFGSELIVAPITTPRDPESRRGRVRAWLPPGVWTDVVTGTVYDGDRHVDLHRPIESIPVLLRAGGIVPLDASAGLDATRLPTELEVLVAPGASGSFTLIEDQEAVVATAWTRLSWDAGSGEFRIRAVVGDEDVVPGRRSWRVTFLSGRPGGQVSVDGTPVEVQGADGRWSVEVEGGTDREIVVRVEGGLAIGSDVEAAAHDVLQAAQMANADKLEAFAVVTNGRPVAARLAELHALSLPESVRGALVELLSSRRP